MEVSVTILTDKLPLSELEGDSSARYGEITQFTGILVFYGMALF